VQKQINLIFLTEKVCIFPKSRIGSGFCTGTAETLTQQAFQQKVDFSSKIKNI